MSQPVARRWTVEQFFAWQERQSERYELVDGFPVRMMAGTKNVHDDVVVNLLAELRNQLRGSGCRPFTGDGSVETRPGQIRRPDAGVDCGRRDPNGYRAAEPKLIVEVLSPSTRDFDTFDKLEEYKSVSTVAYVLLIEPNAPQAMLWRRGDDGSWTRERVEGLESHIELGDLGVSLAMSEPYDGVEFPTGPRLMVL